MLRDEKPKRPTKRNLHDGIVCCLPLVSLTTHTGTLLSTLCRSFFLPAFLQTSLRTDSERFFDRAAATKWMPQGCTRCVVFSRFWAVRWLRQSPLPSGAGRRNLRLWKRREAGWSCLREWRIEALLQHRAECGGSAQLVQKEISARWVSQSWLPIHEDGAEHKWNAGGNAGGQSARSEQHRWVKKKVDFNLMPQDVEDTWGRVEQLKMSVSVRSTPR